MIGGWEAVGLARDRRDRAKIGEGLFVLVTGEPVIERAMPKILILAAFGVHERTQI